MVQEGYDKYYGSVFKVPMMEKWMAVVSGPQLIDDIRRAPEDALSFMGAAVEFLQVDYTMGKEIREDPYHIGTVRTPMTRNLPIRFPDVQEEIVTSFETLVSPKDDEWLSVPAFETVVQIVCSSSNRLFVGSPMCQNPELLKLTAGFSHDVVTAAILLGTLPVPFRPFAAKFLTRIESTIKRVMDHLRPLIEERLQQFELDSLDKGNDMLTWLLQDAPPCYRTIRSLTTRFLTINFGAIHTTSLAFTNCLFDLAANPDFVEPLREELNSILATDGLTPVGMQKMRKMDSFIRESQRLYGGTSLSMTRRVMKDFTFSNGMTVPKGHFVSVAGLATHMDPKNYPNPEEFQPFRFSDMGDDGDSVRSQTISVGLDWVLFGGGRHSCPGRFFALYELKAMLAYVLLNYDVKIPNDGPRPKNLWFGHATLANPRAHVLFRKRKQVPSW
jgi:cytochrome P450